MNEFNVLLGAATNGTPSGSLFDALFARYIAPQESWRELESPLPITILSAGEDLIDYRIYGNTVQTGTPTPENPIMPSGCGERTENLWDAPLVQGVWRAADGVWLAGNAGYLSNTLKVSVDAETTYSFNFTSAAIASINRLYAYFWDSDNTYLGYQDLLPSRVINTPSNAAFLAVSIGTTATSGVIPSDILNIMLTEGSTAPDQYIPYGYKLPLTSAGQDVDIYLGENQTTRRIKKLVLTGEEELNGVSISHRVAIGIRIPCISGYALGEMNTHFVVNSTSEYNLGSKDVYSSRLGTGGGVVWFFIPLNFFSGELNADNCKAEFKSYLAAQYAAGTPVTVWYVLAEAETGIVNEPLMKIGDYADTVSMEQAGVSIPTAVGETIIDYDGTLKPSQMYIKYKSQEEDHD